MIREIIQSHLDKAIEGVNEANQIPLISNYVRTNLIADMLRIKKAVNAAFNYHSPADPPEGSPGQEDLKN